MPIIPPGLSPASEEAGSPGVHQTQHFVLTLKEILVTGNGACYYTHFFFLHFSVIQLIIMNIYYASTWGPGGLGTVEQQDWSTEASGSDGPGFGSCHLMHDLGQIA